MDKRSLLKAGLGSLLSTPSLAAWAQSSSPWPTKTVKLIVPFAPGGPVDQAARIIVPVFSKHLGQTVVVENRAGGGGSIGLAAAMRGEPDGHTIGFGVPGAITILPHVQKLPYDTADINYVSLVIRTPQVLGVGPSVKVDSFKELIALAKQSPGKLAYGSAGNATTPHLGAVLVENETGVKLLHVPYKGAAPALLALLSGEVQIFCGDLPALQPFVSKGVRILAVNGPNRIDAMPGVPTTKELGFPGIHVESNYGIIAPTDMPAAQTQRLHAAVLAAVNDPETRKQLVAAGAIPISNTPREYRQLMEQESAKWAAVVKKNSITLE